MRDIQHQYQHHHHHHTSTVISFSVFFAIHILNTNSIETFHHHVIRMHTRQDEHENEDEDEDEDG
jgi:hypothetical protein